MNLQKYGFVLLAGAAFLLHALAGAVQAGQPRAEKPASRPNVLIILSDDQGWGDLSLDGNTNLQTPNIDALAAAGARFQRFFVCPVCAPTRAEFLTGRYHSRGGVHGVTRGAERLDLDEVTIGDLFRAGGYATGAFGKWHNGTQYPYHPNGRGFAEFYGFCSGHWGQYFDPILEHNGKPVRGSGFIIDDLTEHGLAFIEANKARPFFCYLPFNTPHSPFQVPDRFYDRFRDRPLVKRHRDPRKEELGKTRCALAMCENIDWNVGRVLDKLDELGLADNTIVIYFSDNGPNSWWFNGGMKGRKGSTDEGGVRVPCLVRWPGHIRPGTTIAPIAGAIDLLPTLVGMAGLEHTGTRPLDGVDLRPLLFDTAGQWPERMIFSHYGGRVSVRTDRYRLDHAGRLFDMTSDPGQNHDVTGQRPDVAARLAKSVAQWKTDVMQQAANDQRPFPVGYAEFPVTMLPARDGIPHGTIKRSARAPNCSFFTHWTRVEDKITWDIDVATSGRYEAVVHYTCPQADVGSTIELSFGERRIQTRVVVAHDPPLVGAEFDRVPRGGESYVKEFRPLRIGVLQLEQGRGTLSLSAPKIPAGQVMDVRLLTLTLRPDMAQGGKPSGGGF